MCLIHPTQKSQVLQTQQQNFGKPISGTAKELEWEDEPEVGMKFSIF
jgi:hypothetical protein